MKTIACVLLGVWAGWLLRTIPPLGIVLATLVLAIAWTSWDDDEESERP